MKDEKMLADELMSDEELENIAGGVSDYEAEMKRAIEQHLHGEPNKPQPLTLQEFIGQTEKVIIVN